MRCDTKAELLFVIAVDTSLDRPLRKRPVDQQKGLLARASAGASEGALGKGTSEKSKRRQTR